MTKRIWQDPADLSMSAQARRDEFGPEVADAVAALRAKHGLDGTEPSAAAVDAFRSEAKDLLPGVNRRGFLQLTGAAAVFALAGCYGKHPETIVPYADQPEGTTLGKATWYSTTLRDSGKPVPVMVKLYDGRPIKIEGNPDHPLTKGKADAKTQAALLNLYDPDRIQDGPKKRKDAAFTNTSWSDLDAMVGKQLAAAKRIGLITGPVDGPANTKLISEFSAAFGDRLVHGTVGDSSSLNLNLAAADVIVTFGADLLADASVADQVAFGAFRRLRGEGADATAGQLIAVEGVLSQTGATADVRVRIHPAQAHLVAWAVADAIGAAVPVEAKAALAQTAGGKPLAEALGLKPIAGKDAIAFIAERLLAAKKAGRAGIAYAGVHGPAVAAAWAINDQLNGRSNAYRVSYSDAFAEENGRVFSAVSKGELDVLIVAGCNPAFSRGWDADFVAGLGKVPFLAVLDDRLTETARRAHVVAPTLHDLEQWGDAEPDLDLITIQQPCIQPLWDARASAQSLMAFAVAAGVAPAAFVQPVGKTDNAVALISRAALYQPAVAGVQSWGAYVKQVWLERVRKQSNGLITDERSFWHGVLAKGVIEVLITGSWAVVAPKPSFPAIDTTGLRLVLTPSRAIGADGHLLNNAWLQELPDPVSRITWDNYLAVSPHDAMEQGIRENDVVTLTVGGRSVKLPVHIQEGQHPGVLETFLGWGREKNCAGAVADLGIEHGYSVDVWPFANLTGAATIAKTGETYVLAVAQGHQRMEGRDIAREDILELHRVDPGAAKRHPRHEAWEKGTDGKEGGRLSSFGKHHDYPGRKWGMTVDLSLCTGCNACVVACNAENNVPVVGRDEVRKGRIMHWMRVDRYYQSEDGDQLDVEAIHQPVMCQQCDNAPCEEVCPAMATVHSDEGLNIMVYNRCIGTRYCSNNCPYKTRRFNWYEYSKYRAGPIESGAPLDRILKNVVTEGRTSSQAELTQAPLALLLNPEVTVRSRGVMEKCNFCVQRTREIREREKAAGARIPDGTVTSACAQTCPTNAIVFGDVNDPEAAVTRSAAGIRGYKLLDAELNTRPAVTYLAKLRNRPATAEERKGL
jgi:molybdopterin-containing oxidoreductase family iron-sulfur binding subunit